MRVSSPVHLWRLLLVVAGGAIVWSVAVTMMGGFAITTSSGTLFRTEPIRPLILASVLAAIYAWRRHDVWRADFGAAAEWHWGSIIASVGVALTLLYGIEWGTFIGGGPDQSGYVSEAEKWIQGTLVTAPPDWAQHGGWVNAIWSSVPVGYRPNDAGLIAPIYSPGLPMLMAIFESIGGRDAVYYVVPLLGAATMWGTYLLGMYIAGEWAGAIAALLMLCSAPFLLYVTQPMSDVAVTGCWTLALVCAWRPRTRDAVFAGVASAAAILVRPNIAPLAIIPALLLIGGPDPGAPAAPARRGGVARPTTALRRAAVFMLPIVAAVIIIAVLNARWWGSPFVSGYGHLNELYNVAWIAPNLRRYMAWLIDAQTPLIVAGLAAALVVPQATGQRRRVALLTLGFPILVLLLYVAYLRFDEWEYLRFLLPAYPPVLAGLGAVMVEAARRAWRPAIATMGVAVVALSIGIQEWRFANAHNVFREQAGQRRFARAVDFVNSLPANTIVISNAYSGTLHFYTGRDILRFETMWPNQMDQAIGQLRELGHPLYFVGDEFETAAFKSQFGGSDAANEFDKRRLPDTGDAYVAADFTK